MRGWKHALMTVGLAAVSTFASGCRDEEPEAPPPPGPQGAFEKSFRKLSGELPAPPDEVARAGSSVFKAMGLSNVTTHVSPMWAAVVNGQKPSGMRTPYELRVKAAKDGRPGSYLEISIGFTGDESESRFVVGEICKELNIVGDAPPPQNTPPEGTPPQGTPPEGTSPQGNPPPK